MDKDARALLKRTPLVVRRGPYALCAWPRAHAPPDAFFAVRDELETTALVAEADLAETPPRVERGFAILTLDTPMEWDVVGVLALVTATLAQARIPCGAVAAYSRDHLLVPASRLDEALAALAGLCAEQRFV